MATPPMSLRGCLKTITMERIFLSLYAEFVSCSTRTSRADVAPSAPSATIGPFLHEVEASRKLLKERCTCAKRVRLESSMGNTQFGPCRDLNSPLT
jgi:hypothetical protein